MVINVEVLLKVFDNVQLQRGNIISNRITSASQESRERTNKGGWLLDLEGLEALITFASSLDKGIGGMVLCRDTRSENRSTYTALVSYSKGINNRSSIVSILPRENLMPTQCRVRVSTEVAGVPISKENIAGETVGGNI